MTIAQRLLILVVLAVLGTIAVGVVGLGSAASSNANLERVNRESIPRLVKVESIEAAYLRYRINFLTLTFVAPPDQKPAVKRLMDKAKADLEQILQEYSTMVANDKDREYLETTRKTVAEYFTLLERTGAHLANNEMDEVKKLSAVAREISGRLSQNIEAHAKYNVELAATEAREEAEAYVMARRAAIGILLLIGAIVAGVGFVTFRHVSQSLAFLESSMERVAENLDFSTSLPVGRQDEIGLTITAFNRLLQRVRQTLSDVLGKSGSVSQAAEKLSSASHQMSGASEQQSESASAMAAAMEQLTVSISHVAERAGDATRLAEESGKSAAHGTAIINQTVTDIDGIADTVRTATEQFERLEHYSSRINSVVSVIKEVADQTNLLALNAAIEAARAGEQGRGFAVVADEVRKLAERTTQSTLEIGTTIDEMQTTARSAAEGIQAVSARVEKGVSQARLANETIGQITQASRETAAMVSEISCAIREQSVASTTVAQQVEQIAQIAEENSAAAHGTATTAGELESLAKDMQVVVGKYRV
jgi:methyl-accepting chemotaxis protein